MGERICLCKVVTADIIISTLKDLPRHCPTPICLHAFMLENIKVPLATDEGTKQLFGTVPLYSNVFEEKKVEATYGNNLRTSRFMCVWGKGNLSF